MSVILSWPRLPRDLAKDVLRGGKLFYISITYSRRTVQCSPVDPSRSPIPVTQSPKPLATTVWPPLVLKVDPPTENKAICAHLYWRQQGLVRRPLRLCPMFINVLIILWAAAGYTVNVHNQSRLNGSVSATEHIFGQKPYCHFHFLCSWHYRCSHS